MQFSPTADGYKIKELYKLQGAKKMVSLTGDVSYNWRNKGLSGVEKDTLDKYFAMVGQNFWAHYKKAIKGWEKFAQDRLNEIEKKMVAAEDAVIKRLKKKIPSAKQLEDEKNKLILMRDQMVVKFEIAIQEKYQALLPDLSKKAHDEAVKKLGNAASKLKKKHGDFIWAVVKFALVATAITFAAIALGPVGAAVATAAGVLVLSSLILKGVSTGITAIKDLATYLKQWNKISDKAATEIDNAAEAVEKALETMEACHSVYESLSIRFATAKGKIDEMEKEVNKDKNAKEMADAMKELAAARKQLDIMEEAIGRKPSEVLKHLKVARTAITKADAAAPSKVVDRTSKVADFLNNAAAVADKAVSAF